MHITCDYLTSNEINILRALGPMADTDTNGICDVIAFIEDPDGYKIELIEVR